MNEFLPDMSSPTFRFLMMVIGLGCAAIVFRNLWKTWEASGKIQKSKKRHRRGKRTAKRP